MSTLLTTRSKSTTNLKHYVQCRISNPLLIIIVWLISMNFIYLHYAHNSLWITIYLNPPTPQVIAPTDSNNMENAPNKIAFLFLTRDYIETPKVWDRFFENQHNKQYYNIYVHPKYPNNITSRQPYVYNNVLPHHLLVNNTERFTYSLVHASNTMFKYALKDPLNKKFVLLSETTIPLYNFKTIYDKLMYNNNNFSWGLQEGTEGRTNCFEDIYANIRNHSINGLGMTGTEFEAKFVPREICVHTTQWIILDRNIIEKYLLKYEHYWAQFYQCDESFADEDYYSNMLVKFMNDSKEKELIEPKGVTYYWFNPIDWTHAAYFGNVSNQWIDELRSDGYLFLRKVNDSSILDVNYLLTS